MTLSGRHLDVLPSGQLGQGYWFSKSRRHNPEISLALVRLFIQVRHDQPANDQSRINRRLIRTASQVQGADQCR